MGIFVAESTAPMADVSGSLCPVLYTLIGIASEQAVCARVPLRVFALVHGASAD